jgi:hypothetical protein
MVKVMAQLTHFMPLLRVLAAPHPILIKSCCICETIASSTEASDSKKLHWIFALGVTGSGTYSSSLMGFFTLNPGTGSVRALGSSNRGSRLCGVSVITEQIPSGQCSNLQATKVHVA